MKDYYDVIIVGAGPAGSIAAVTVAKKGLSALLIEKRQEIGAPVRCAEGIGKVRLEKHIRPDPDWICAKISGACIYAPDGTLIRMSDEYAGNEVGYVLDRKIFDRALAEQAAAAGANVMVKTRCTGLIIENGSVRGITMMHRGQLHRVRAGIVIGADGVESKIGRWAGIDTTLKPSQIETCAQFLVSGLDIDPTCGHFYVGNKIAPAGYLWLFPKGNGLFNAGIGILGDRALEDKPIELLSDFIDNNFPEARIIEMVAGGVPATGPIKRTIADGLMLVGDAARQSDPLTGGGIANALDAGEIAGNVAVEAINKKDLSTKTLKAYEARWRMTIGTELSKNLIIQNTIFHLEDSELNSLAHSIKDIDFKKMELMELVTAMFKYNRKLLISLHPLFSEKIKKRISALNVLSR